MHELQRKLPHGTDKILHGMLKCSFVVASQNVGMLHADSVHGSMCSATLDQPATCARWGYAGPSPSLITKASADMPHYSCMHP